MNCRKVSHLLSAYMDAELPGVEHRQVHEHIAHCDDCAKEYHALLRMKRLLAGMRVREPQADLPHRIISHIHTQNQHTRTSPWWWTLRGWLELNVSKRAALPVVASMAAMAVIYLSVAIDHSNEIAFHPTPPGVTRLPEEQPEIASVPPIQNYSEFESNTPQPRVIGVNAQSYSSPPQNSDILVMPGYRRNTHVPRYFDNGIFIVSPGR